MLSKRWIINYLLILLILLFTWIGNRYDVKTPWMDGQPQSANSSARRISKLRPADVNNIDIATADTSLALNRDAAGWSLTSPVSWPADNTNVERLLDLLNSESDSQLPVAELDLASVGLDRPRALIRLNQQSLSFGDTNQIGERRYLMIDDMVYLVADNHLPFVSQGMLGLVDRRLLPARLAPVELVLPGLELVRDADNWKLSKGDEYNAAQIEELVANWIQLPASRVENYRSGQTPRQKIRARLEDGRELEFYLLSIEPEIIVANPAIGLQYRFRSEYYYRLIALRADEDPA